MNSFIAESVQLTECHNHTAVEFIEQNQTQWQIIIIISALMNGLLLIVLIGELLSALCKNINVMLFIYRQLKLMKYVNIPYAFKFILLFIRMLLCFYYCVIYVT